jgi:hypothetical protein
VPADHEPEDWRRVEQRYGSALESATAEGRLERHREPGGEGWRVPPRYRFVADDVIAWLMARARPAAG